MAALAVYVMYTRLKNWLESNVPILYYVFLIIYMRQWMADVPLWLSLAGMGCALILRFEFMNEFFTAVVKFIEFGDAGGDYLSLRDYGLAILSTMLTSPPASLSPDTRAIRHRAK